MFLDKCFQLSLVSVLVVEVGRFEDFGKVLYFSVRSIHVIVWYAPFIVMKYLAERNSIAASAHLTTSAHHAVIFNLGHVFLMSALMS